MCLGTAGYAAMLCVMALQRFGVTPNAEPVAVSGAAGGVGSIALMLLSHLEYEAIAITGRPAETDYLRSLGAQSIVDRSEFCSPGKPLRRERWIGAIDTAGTNILANMCASMRYGGVVAACGLAAGMDLPATVAPFILRGVMLTGIDSAMCPQELRREAWERLARDIDPDRLELAARVFTLEQAVEVAPQILHGTVRGPHCR